jgi:hypothetical protein
MSIQLDAQMCSFIAGVVWLYMFRVYAPIFRSNSICNSSKMVFWSFSSGGNCVGSGGVKTCCSWRSHYWTVVAPSATAHLHTTATHAVPSTTETPEHHFAAVANTITPEDGPIHLKHVESYTTCNKAIHLCIKLDSHLPYDYDARSHKPQSDFSVTSHICLHSIHWLLFLMQAHFLFCKVPNESYYK